MIDKTLLFSLRVVFGTIEKIWSSKSASSMVPPDAFMWRGYDIPHTDDAAIVKTQI
ncbi:MAG: hypothetical protein HY895_20835 [Deltaproteobacteria bacterium]|nr:hypothetical protein [Deltaproteobacteria bacterium]